MSDWPTTPPALPIEPGENTTDVTIISPSEKIEAFSIQSGFAAPVSTGAFTGGRFAPGVSGNPRGRKKGSRNKLTQTVLSALLEDFSVNGADALAALRTTSPEAYMRVIISLLPRSLIMQFEEKPDVDYENMSESELVHLLDNLQRQKLIEQAIETISKL